MKKILLIIIPILLLTGCSYEIIKKSNQNNETQTNSPQVTSNSLDLQIKCSDVAKKFFIDNGYKKSEGSDYTNHYNQKLNKCFIQITQTDSKDDFISIDIYDAFEGKMYALYIGHNLCRPADLIVLGDQKHCQLDSGSIWFNGDNTKEADYKVGYGAGNTVGDENTQKQFMEHIQQFMNN